MIDALASVRSAGAWRIALCLPLLALSGGAWAGENVVLDETCVFRQYCRFDVNRYDSALVKSDGRRFIGRDGMVRLKRSVERLMRQRGIDPAKTDWRDHACLGMGGGSRAFSPVPGPPPPADWMGPQFDDRLWVRRRGVFQSGRAVKITNRVLGQFDEWMDLRLQQACYRARFVVADPAKASALSLRVTYTGGVRVFLNGEEIARGHLPAGELAPGAMAETYPAEAYRDQGQAPPRPVRRAGPHRAVGAPQGRQRPGHREPRQPVPSRRYEVSHSAQLGRALAPLAPREGLDRRADGRVGRRAVGQAPPGRRAGLGRGHPPPRRVG